MVASLLLASVFAAPPVCPGPAWFREGDQTDCRLGTVAPAGDVNGDGFADVLIGSYRYSLPEQYEGVIFVYLGSLAGLSSAPACTLQVDQAGARFADKLSTAGDVNGDGYDDVVSGAAQYSDPELHEGKALLFMGGPGGLSTTPAWSAERNQAEAEFGASMASAGDVNGDGYDDVAVGSWLYDHGQLNEGAVWVYLGSDTGLADAPDWTAESNSAGAAFGYRALTAGDLNADGYDDLVIGARRYSGDGVTREGRAYVYLGGPTGLASTPVWTYDGNAPETELGNTVGAAGDVNHDGYGDLIIGAYRWDGGGTDRGKAMLFLGGPGGPAATPAWTYQGAPNEFFGYHCVGLGDVNRDGFDDVLIGAPQHVASGLANAGAAYLFLGDSTGLALTPAWMREGDQAGESYGNAVGAAGDVDHDGYTDFLVGILYQDNAWVDAGRAELYRGCRTTTAVPPSEATHVALAAHPVPARGDVEFSFALDRTSQVRLTVHDIAGREVTRVLDRMLDPGPHQARWTRPAARPGVYFARLVIDGRTTATLPLVRLE